MPPEVLKPYAVTTVKDLASIIQLLGLYWTVFNPDEGLFRAESEDSILNSYQIRSLGTVVSFSKVDGRVEKRRLLHGIVHSPLEGAIALGFGIIISDIFISQLEGLQYRRLSGYDTFVMPWR